MTLPPGSVLVVDDDDALRSTLTRHLRRRGYEVRSARDGREALDLVVEQSCDVIISDLSMPGMDGIAMMRAVREVDLDVPIVLLTGAPSIESARAAIELGAFRYLLKPAEPRELEAAIARAIVTRRMARLKREALTALGRCGSEGAFDLAGLEVGFERALARLWVAFQPIVRGADGSVFGYEALMRSDEPSLPHPHAMLMAAERLGRLPDLGRVVRAQTANAIAQAPSGWVFFVNLHPADLLDDDLFASDAPLTKYAGRVVLEVTERAPIHNMVELKGRVRALRRMGFRIAVDDLGAGYAGLASFVTLEPDIVKLDMTLTRGIDQNVTKQRIVDSLVRLCGEIGTLVVSEGIETEQERDCIVRTGCDLVQGYFVARPDRGFPTVHW